MVKAVVLLSGGLDSLLAAKIMQLQNVMLFGINFTSCFFSSKRAQAAATLLNVPLHIVDITEPLLNIIKAPRWGYGKGVNPCVDCHILMVKEAVKYMQVVQAEFIVTGEVLGERPKSQTSNNLRIVEREGNAEGRLLRPLSAKLLPPTIAEREGLVDRDKLYAIHGRRRRVQMRLAQEFGFTSYSTPGGGCLLTDPNFAARFKDLLRRKPDFTLADVFLLKIGRHFSVNGIKVIVARNAKENEEILKLPAKVYLIVGDNNDNDVVASVQGDDKATIMVAAALTARYSRTKYQEKVKVTIWRPQQIIKEVIMVRPLSLAEADRLRVTC